MQCTECSGGGWPELCVPRGDAGTCVLLSFLPPKPSGTHTRTGSLPPLLCCNAHVQSPRRVSACVWVSVHPAIASCVHCLQGNPPGGSCGNAAPEERSPYLALEAALLSFGGSSTILWRQLYYPLEAARLSFCSFAPVPSTLPPRSFSPCNHASDWSCGSDAGDRAGPRAPPGGALHPLRRPLCKHQLYPRVDPVVPLPVAHPVGLLWLHHQPIYRRGGRGGGGGEG